MSLKMQSEVDALRERVGALEGKLAKIEEQLGPLLELPRAVRLYEQRSSMNFLNSRRKLEGQVSSIEERQRDLRKLVRSHFGRSRLPQDPQPQAEPGPDPLEGFDPKKVPFPNSLRERGYAPAVEPEL